MSPVEGCSRSCEWGFPRVSGDEPIIDAPTLLLKEFSPRERG